MNKDGSNFSEPCLVVVFVAALLISITVIWNIWLIHNSRKRQRSSAFVAEHIKNDSLIQNTFLVIFQVLDKLLLCNK